MPVAEPYQYAVWRLVADLQRGETLNVGLVLFCRRATFLQARTHLDAPRLAAVAPQLDRRPLEDHLEGLTRIAAGDPAAGTVAALEPSERFGWLVAPASTLVQPGPVHTGLCVHPGELLERLFARLVL